MRVLVIDDQETILRTFKLRLTQWGYGVFVASDGSKGLDILRSTPCDVAITDLKMPGLSGEELVRQISQEFPETEIVVITGYATVESAVAIMKIGVSDFFAKPLDFDQIRNVLKKIEGRLRLKEENQLLRDRLEELGTQVSHQFRFANLIGKSPPMRRVFNLLATVAPLECTVTIYGETGTGKEMVAKAIHHNSRRASRPLITVDCGALSDSLLESELFGHEKGAFTGATKSKRGRVELADGGTIFLDEVANASSKVQKKLLRVIQEKSVERLGGETSTKVNVRIIAASNQELSSLVKAGAFREDLFYRLNVFPINLPPLRKRKGDIPLLARYFLDLFSRQMERESLDLSHEALEQLSQHFWPGNVRELANIMERVAVMTSGKIIRTVPIEIEEDIVTPYVPESGPVPLDPPLTEQISNLELNYLKRALETYHGRIKDVSHQSGLNPRTLYRKMKHHGLDKRDFR
ncbi:MAG: sigma-54 dependent transcriptional regulator [Desulfatiglans sp.]|jgi:DNA-binding NtrC family response regulator|nr:sigma-54 dependent transcriptional regulator [Thermodesulfobacteriota bacterium]MEE4353558.1 sigma-54 dependent transcriptional regulator [Desulfatiglans sp.]